MEIENNNYRQSLFISVDGVIRVVIVAMYEHVEKIFTVKYFSQHDNTITSSNNFQDIINFVNPRISNFENIRIYVCNGNMYSVDDIYEQPFTNYILIDSNLLLGSISTLIT
jgi:hypothetical protein